MGVVFIVFVVCMLLWGISVLVESAPNAPPWTPRVGAVCAWLSVLCLFLLGHGTRV